MKPTVVVGYDQTPSSDHALHEAGREAAWRGADVAVVHAFRWVPAASPMAYVPLQVELTLKDAAMETATAGADWLRHHYPGMAVEARAISGPTADALTEAARDADLLVLGSRGRGGFAGLLLGSVSLRTLSLASCPTLVVRGEQREPHDVVILALDIEDPADEVLDFAFAEASLRRAHLRVVNVWDLSWNSAVAPETADALDTARADAAADLHTALGKLLHPWQTKHPAVRVDIEVADGTPSAVLTQETAHADLIITGAHHRADGHPGMRPGPIVHTLLHHADCPVAVVPRG